MAVVNSNDLAHLLAEAGVIPKDRLNKITRIVIDIRSGAPVMVYTQEFGEPEALKNMVPMLKGMLE